MNKSLLPMLIILGIPLIILIFVILIKSKSSKEIESESVLDPTSKQSSESTMANNMQNTDKPNIVPKDYTVTLKTSEGDITLVLTGTKTPITVDNFVTLAQKGFYDNTIFHRVIEGFMIQGGDPEGTGAGGPGYTFEDEPFDAEYTRGTIAMANRGPDTNGSQFFIMHQDYSLPKNYVIFGKVTQGLDVVDKIATAPVTASFTGEGSKPVTPVKVLNVVVTELK